MIRIRYILLRPDPLIQEDRRTHQFRFPIEVKQIDFRPKSFDASPG